MDPIRNTLRYIALSYKINFTGGARLLVWMVLLILPSVLEIINSRVYSGLIDSFAGLTAGTAVTKLLFMADTRHCRPWSVQCC